MELAYNTAQNTSTDHPSVKLLYTQPPDILKRLLQPQPVNPMNESVKEWLEKISVRITDVQESIRYTANLQKKYYDRRHLPIPPYKVGDYASLWLDKHPTSVPHIKLSMQQLPPYQILRVLSNGRAVELEFSENLSVKAQVRDLPKMGISQCPTSS